MTPAPCAAATARTIWMAIVRVWEKSSEPHSRTARSVTPVDVFGGEELHPAVVADVVDRQDVGMVQRGDGPCLPLKPLQPLVVSRSTRRQDLQRQPPAQARVLSEVHLRHAARSKRRHDSIMRQHVAGGEGPAHTVDVEVTGIF